MIDIVDQMANAILELKTSMKEYHNSIKNRDNPDFDLNECYFYYLKYKQAKTHFENTEELFNASSYIHREGVQLRDEEEYGIC